MHALECPVECRGRLVAIFQRNIHNLPLIILQIKSRFCHTPPPDIFGQRDSGEIGKHSLEMKRRTACDFCRCSVVNFSFQLCFDIGKSLIHLLDPFHFYQLLFCIIRNMLQKIL